MTEEDAKRMRLLERLKRESLSTPEEDAEYLQLRRAHVIDMVDKEEQQKAEAIAAEAIVAEEALP